MSPSDRRERHGRFYYNKPDMKVAIREEMSVGFENSTYYWEIFDHSTVRKALS